MIKFIIFQYFMLLEVQSPSPSLYFILKISHIEFHLLKGSLSPPMRRSIRIIWLNDYHFLITLNVWENPQFNKTFKLLEAKKKKKKKHMHYHIPNSSFGSSFYTTSKPQLVFLKYTNIYLRAII